MEIINIPKSWDEITVNTFNELREIELDLLEFSNNYEKNIAILSTLLNVDEEYFDEFDVDEISDMFKSIEFINRQPSIDFLKIIGEYHFKELDSISFGEFIDINYFMEDNYYKNINIICAILYRRQRESDWNTIEIEPYRLINIWSRSTEFNNLPITNVFGIIQHILKWKENIMNTYVSVFQPVIEDADPDDELSAEDLADEAKEKELAKFSWQFVIDMLTNGDITKIEAVTDLPLTQVMNYLTMKKLKP
jgi:hypothetical protein